MPVGRLKTMIIFILVAANLALAGLFLLRQNRPGEHDTLAGAVSVLEQGGIRLNCTLPEGIACAPVRTTRDRDSEAAFMTHFLGQSTITDQGGPVGFIGPGGEGYLRENGEFELTLTDAAHSTATADAAASLLTKAGLSVELVSESETVFVFRQLLDGIPVRQHHITMTYQDDVLQLVQGQFISPSRQTVPFSDELLDMPTLLLQFYAGIRSGGYICSVISDVTVVYQATATGSGFSPYWHFHTDTGSYFVDPVTGELTV